MNYRKEIQDTAKQLLEDASIHSKQDYNDTCIETLISEEADRAVIYTKNAYNIMLNTSNDDAYLDVGVTLDPSQGATSLITQMAYYAYHQDLAEAIDALISDLPDTKEASEAGESHD